MSSIPDEGVVAAVAAGAGGGPARQSPAMESRARLVTGGAIVIGMMVNMPSLVGSTFSLFLKPVSQEFGWGRDVMSFAVLLSVLVTTPMYPLIGRLVDRRGVRAVALPGMVLFGASVIGMALTTRAPIVFDLMFLVLSALATLVSGVVFGRAVAGAFDQARGKALGLCLGLGGGLGAAVAPLIAQALITSLGWRIAYAGLGLLPILIGFPVLMIFLKSTGPSPPAAQGVRAPEPAPGAGLLQAARSPVLWIIGALIFFSCFANNGMLVHLGALLTDRGTSAATAAAMLSAIALATSVGQITSGFLLDRVNSPYVGAPFAASLLAGLLLLHHGGTPAAQFSGVILFGLGIGSEYSLLPYYLTRYFGLRSFGQLYGAMYAVAAIAGGLGPYVMGSLFESTRSYGPALTIFEVGMAIAVCCIFALKRYVYLPGATDRAAQAATAST